MAIPLIDATRQNHALEHATISLAIQRLGLNIRLLGRSTPFCYYIHGDLPTDVVTECAHEGLARLQHGEAELAISPLCGTNFALSGLLAAFASILAFGNGKTPERYSRSVMAATGAILVAQPLGRLAQKYLTTSPELSRVSIRSITVTGVGGSTTHKVETVRR